MGKKKKAIIELFFCKAVIVVNEGLDTRKFCTIKSLNPAERCHEGMTPKPWDRNVKLLRTEHSLITNRGSSCQGLNEANWQRAFITQEWSFNAICQKALPFNHDPSERKEYNYLIICSLYPKTKLIILKALNWEQIVYYQLKKPTALAQAQNKPGKGSEIRPATVLSTRRGEKVVDTITSAFVAADLCSSSSLTDHFRFCY